MQSSGIDTQCLRLANEIRTFLSINFIKSVETSRPHLLQEYCATANDKQVLQGLSERLLRGAKTDVKSFVEKNFHLPLGIRANLIVGLNVLLKEWQDTNKEKKKRYRGPSAEILCDEACRSLIKRWKGGAVTPAELFEDINNAVAEGHMDNHLALRMIDLTLQDAGYKTSCMGNSREAFERSKRFRVDTQGFDLAAVRNIAPSVGGIGLEVTSCIDGIAYGISAEDHTVHELKVAMSCNPTTRPSEICWRWQRSSCGTSTSSSSNLLLLQPTGRDGKLVLQIGEVLRMDDGTIEIDSVIGADVSPPLLQKRAEGELLSAVILIEGRWGGGSGWLDDGLPLPPDGASDLGEGDEGEDDNSTGASHDENEEGQGRRRNITSAVQTVCRRYYCIFATCFQGGFKVRAAVPLSESLLLDQKPTTVLALRVGAALVAGINGYLSVVEAEDNISIAHHMRSPLRAPHFQRAAAASTGADEDPEKMIGAAPMVTAWYRQREDPYFSRFRSSTLPSRRGRVTTLTRDCFPCNARDIEGTSRSSWWNVPTHASDATITAIDYTGDEAAIIVSGDNNGMLCIWTMPYDRDNDEYRTSTDNYEGEGNFSISQDEGMQHKTKKAETLLRAPPLRLGTRVHSVVVSPSGQHVAVGLWDRLLLVALGTDCDNDGLHPHPVLYVRSSLDIVTHCRAEYSVTFGPTSLHIWRLTNKPAVSPPLGSSESVPSGMTARRPLQQSPFAGQRTRSFSVTGPGTMQSLAGPTPVGPASAIFGSTRPNVSENNETFAATSIESVPLGVTITSWLHPNVDNFETRFGLVWGDEECTGSDDLSSPLVLPTDEEISLPMHTLMTTATAGGAAKVDHSKQHSSAAEGTLSTASTAMSTPSRLQLPIVASASSTSTSTSTSIVAASPAVGRARSFSDAQSGTSRSNDYGNGNSRNTSIFSSPMPPIAGTPQRVAAASTTPLWGRRSPYPRRESATATSLLMIQTCGRLAHPSTSTPPSTSAAAATTIEQDVTSTFIPSRPTTTQIDSNTQPTAAIPSLSAPTSITTASNTTISTGTDRPPTVQLSERTLTRASHRNNSSYNNIIAASSSTSTSTSSQSGRGAGESPVTLRFVRALIDAFLHESSQEFQRAKIFLSVYCALQQTPCADLIAAALEGTTEVSSAVSIPPTSIPLLTSANGASASIPGGVTISTVIDTFTSPSLARFFTLSPPLPPALSGRRTIEESSEFLGITKWLCSTDSARLGKEFWVDVSIGHSYLCALYLRYCGNKSVAVEHPWQEYLRTYGPHHLRHSSRCLRGLTLQIRKIDETANIKGTLPRQLGYVVGLQEMYARRVGLIGRLPTELGQLKQLRVLSMGNNQLCGELPESLGGLHSLQRIVLHQNRLTGRVPESLGRLGCIVNLAGNPGLQHGADVPASEREALITLFTATSGPHWTSKHGWTSSEPVAKWYKVGVLLSHVHSIVMSSNGMEGQLPPALERLTHLRMIELATMPGLTGSIPPQLCSLTTLRRLCICRCGITGRIPNDIGRLVGLEELQLFGNHLSGAIPNSLSELTRLKLLSLGEYTGGNDFSPAPLPQCISSLQSLEALFMANCNLRGPLPSWIGRLSELRQLDLQRNSLSGSIPPSIGQLNNLLYLNIKDNENMRGTLPVAQLAQLTKLNRLSLVHCNFDRAEEAVDELQTLLPRCKIWL